MDTAKIVQEIDAEIARLTHARNILTASNSHTHTRRNTSKNPPAIPQDLESVKARFNPHLDIVRDDLRQGDKV